MTSDTPTPAQEAHVETLAALLFDVVFPGEREGDPYWFNAYRGDWMAQARAVIAAIEEGRWSPPGAARAGDALTEAERVELAIAFGGCPFDEDVNDGSMCRCGHDWHQHDAESVPQLCMVCGDCAHCRARSTESAPSGLTEAEIETLLADHVAGFSSVVYCAGDAECDWIAVHGGTRGVVQHRAHLAAVLAAGYRKQADR